MKHTISLAITAQSNGIEPHLRKYCASCKYLYSECLPENDFRGIIRRKQCVKRELEDRSLQYHSPR